MTTIKVPPDVDADVFRAVVLENMSGKTVLRGAEALADPVKRGLLSMEAAEAVMAKGRPFDSEDDQ